LSTELTQPWIREPTDVRKEKLSMTAQAALKAATPSMRELSEETGIRYSTLRAWSAGARIPSAEHVATLASALRRRANRLQEMAGELERAAGA
jgi:hypothetical protein